MSSPEEQSLIQDLLKRLEIAERNVEEERRKAEEERRKAEEFQEELHRKIGFGFIQKYGFPPLGKHQVSMSSKPSYGNHPAIGKPVLRLDNCTFEIVKGYSTQDFPDKGSQIWTNVQSDGTLGPWNHEMQLQIYAREVLQDICELARLPIEVCVEIDLAVVSKHRADIVLFKKGGKLIGMCEVKRSSMKSNQNKTSDLNSQEDLNNQLSNYLQLLRNVHGCKRPFGIVTTYNEWLIVWLDSSSTIAAATSIEEIQSTEEKELSEDIERLKATYEVLFCSEVYHRSSKILPGALASVLLKMLHGEKTPLTTLKRFKGENDRKFGKVAIDSSENDFTWELLPLSKDFRLTYTMPGNATKFLYLLQDYHGGADGRVWLSCNSSGKLLVIKLSKDRKYEEEADRWHKIWKQNDVRVEKLLGANALFMPFAFHGYCANGMVKFRPINMWTASDEDMTVEDLLQTEVECDLDRTSLENYFKNPLLAAQEAIKKMAEAGFQHADLHWRHVALLPTSSDGAEKPWIVVPILIDLHYLRKLDENESIEKVIEESMGILTEELEHAESLPPNQLEVLSSCKV